MSETRLPTLPHFSGRFLRYVLAFGVTLAVGLAPLLGSNKIRIPGFVALLDLFPISMQSWLIPFAAFVMAIPAMSVQFFAEEHVTRRRLRFTFSAALAAMFVTLLTLSGIYTLYVVPIPIPGSTRVAAYVSGVTMLATCPCKDLPLEQCIGEKISLNPIEIEGCYSGREVRQRKLALSGAYLLFMASFGAAVGVLILREERGVRDKLVAGRRGVPSRKKARE